ncbi:MAG: alpha/beta fold hydrolase [Actinomycetota bacterium]|nr:alpha/beta fold hydrolase [Actinomycetota bacterium]
MNPAGQPWLAARQLVAHGTHATGLAAASMRTALGALSHTVVTVTRPAGVRGLALEAGVLVAHLIMYPWGALTEQVRPGGPYDCYRTDDLPPTERGLVITDVRTTGMPILLVHGFADNRSAFAVLGRALRRRGFGVVYGLNYSVFTALTGDVRSAARELGREVEQICEATSAEQVHVVGHSMGGLVARYYVQRLGGDARVHTLVTLGTPHHGTMAAYLLPTPVLRQLRPNSDIVTELAAPSPGCRTRFVAVWSELDEWIVPQRNARLDHPDLLVTNYQLSDVGHLSLPVDPHTVLTVASTLAPQLDGSPPARQRTTATTADDLAAEAATPNTVGSSPLSAS